MTQSDLNLKKKILLNSDLRTQSMYQMMDPLFVGLIFAVFLKDKNGSGNKIELTCFQSYQNNAGEFQRREVPLCIQNSPLNIHTLDGKYLF